MPEIQDKKEYRHNYYIANKKAIIISQKKYYLANKEWINKRNKEYYQKHRETIINYKRDYYKKHKKEMNMKARKYYQEHKKEILIYHTEYAKNNSTKIVERINNWRKNNPDKFHRLNKANKANRRQLGFKVWNKSFKGAHAHHFDKDNVIYIPEKIHRSMYHNVKTGQNMTEINILAFTWLLQKGWVA